MDDYESLSHTKWDCKYHVVFIPKYRRKTLYGELHDECATHRYPRGHAYRSPPISGIATGFTRRGRRARPA
jgi:Transposase IS200 like